MNLFTPRWLDVPNSSRFLNEDSKTTAEDKNEIEKPKTELRAADEGEDEISRLKEDLKTAEEC